MYNLILPWLFSPTFLSQPENAAFLEFDENDPFNQPLYAFRRQYLAQKAFDARESLSLIQALTLVLAGEHDALVPMADTQALAQGINRARHVALPEAGHLFNLEHPKPFHDAILDFLA